MKTIGIICACDTELKPFLPYLEQVRARKPLCIDFIADFCPDSRWFVCSAESVR